MIKHAWAHLFILTASVLYFAMAEAEEVSFKRDVLPQLQYHCVNCHQSYDRHGYLILEDAFAYVQLVGVPAYQLPTMKRVEPGKPEQSYLWLKGTGEHIEAGGYGWTMPFSSGFDGELKDSIYQWIVQGAKNN